ncbi:MAG: acyl-CoA thioesterase, partial [Alistipes sp.]
MDYYDQILGAEVLLGRLRIITVATSNSDIRQIHFTDTPRVTTTCEKIGTKSMNLVQRILCGEEVCSESRSVMVAFDFEAQEALPVPAEWC